MIASLETLFSLLLPAAIFAGTKHPTSATSTTIDNLQAAFNGESNARHRYLAFAKKADEEG